MIINFKKLVTRGDWENALAAAIDDARKAVAARNETAISKANDQLNKYIDASPAEKWWSTDLDDHAREAIGALAVDIATLTIDDLAERTEELRRIAKAVGGTAADNEDFAAEVRHESLTKALLAAMEAAKAAKDLQAVVKENSDDQEIADAAGSLLEAIAEFKAVVGK